MAVSVAQGMPTHLVTVTGTKNLLKRPQVKLAARNLAVSRERMQSLIEGNSKLL